MPKMNSTAPAKMPSEIHYGFLSNELVSLLERSRRPSAGALNAVMTTTH
jgi:hypothetical protein